MEIGNIKPIKIEEEMRNSYLDYAMSVIVARALPDVRDGLKPVQRRILFAMEELGLRYNGPYKKSARIVGEVLGKYHPHGDTSVYDAMVRMAQDFSLRYLLVDGQGNFGSMDNDPPAAMRYTEARLAQIAQEMLADIDKETVNFSPNFDGSLKEPTVMPARLPNLLVNGASGIAVGMATNIPPHNLSEVADAIGHLIEQPDATVDDLAKFVQGPDFPTGGIILGREGIQSAYNTGHGRVVVRAKAYFEEENKGRSQIIVTELPYQTNKSALLERIAHLGRDKRVEGIAEVRDESDRQGMRIVIEVRKEAQPEQVLNNLYKHTAMQSAFFVNMLALVDGQPRVLSLKEMLQHYIAFRQEVITRRSRFDLRRAEERAHILEGLRIALDNLDRVIATIRKSETVEIARAALMKDFNLSQVQAQAILDMQLRRLAALERKKIDDEYEELLKTISYLEDLLANPRKIMTVIKDEVLALKSKYGDPRRTRISDEEARPFSEADLIPHQQVVVTLSTRGYIKRLPVETYRLQRRGGRGITGVVTKEAEAVLQLTVADTHDYFFFFTNRGKVYRLRCHEIPGDSTRTAKGLPIVNLIAMDTQERVTALVKVTDMGANSAMIMATRMGEVKRTPLEDFSLVRSNGLIATDLEAGDELVAAQLASEGDEVIMVSHRGQSILFPVSQLRSASRTSGGVRGLKIDPDDKLVAMDIVDPKGLLLVVSENGIGKLTPLSAYPRQHRGGGGVRTLRVTDKTGGVAASLVAHPGHELMIVSGDGILIRTQVDDISTLGRDTQGVMLMRLEQGDKVVSCACLDTRNGSAKPEKQGPDAP